MRATTVLKTTVAAALLSLVGPAQAVFHLMKIVEVFGGTPASPSAQYVVLQMYASGQNLVAGHTVTFFNAAGALVATFTFPGNVSNGANQAKILIATPEAASFFGITPDLGMSAAVLAAGGKVCFADTIDCVAWGTYAGSSAGVGTPFNASGGGILSGRAAVRRLDIAGGATTLDGADDTNNCAVDFVTGLPSPRNNAGVTGTVPASTCGNGMLEGLEQCDDGNTSNNDTCSSTCMVQQAPSHAAGDYNGDGKSDIFWRNGSNGADVIWRSASAATPQTVTAITDLNWKVVARGDFDGSGRADVFWRHAQSGSNAIWLSANSATPQATTGVSMLSWKIAGTGDFNVDGKADVLWRNDVSGANVLWRSGQYTQGQSLTTVGDLSWKIAGIGDFDGEGHADILWRNSSTGANLLWRAGLSAQRQTLATVADQNWKVAGVGDFDGDGNDDILWRNSSYGANALWRSALSTQAQALTAVSDQNWKVVGVGDFNGDGKADILWRHSSGANVIWRSGLSAQSQAVASVGAAWSVVP